MTEWIEAISAYYTSLTLAGFFKAVWAMCFACISFLFGFDYLPVQSLVVLIFMDLGLGSARAVARRKREDFSGRKFIIQGMGKIIVYGLGMQIALHTDASLGLTTGSLISFRVYLCAFLAIHEALSCLVHLEAFGFPLIRSGFKDWLARYGESLAHPRRRSGDHPLEVPSDKL